MHQEKFVFFDIDGTLIDSLIGIDDIPKSTIESLDLLKENGHRVFIATGRCQSFIVDSVASYPFDGFVTCNGGYVTYNRENIYKAPIPLSAMKNAIDFAIKYHTILYLESNEFIYIVNGDKKEHLDFQEKWQMKRSIQKHAFNVEEIETYIAMMLVNDESQFELLKIELGDDFLIQQHPNQLSFDLTLKGTSKAKGILALTNKMNVDINDVFAFGDGNNDLEMISTVGYGIAMGNAVDALKEVAIDVTDRIENKGIKKALIKYKLI